MTRAGPVVLDDMVLQLTSQGLRVAVTHPAKPQARAPLTTRGISLPFLVVTSDGSEEVVVVDPTLREHLAVAPSTPAYARTLATDVPEIFVGTPARLGELIASMAAAISLNFSSQGVAVPPWRRKAALLSRWSVLGGMEAWPAGGRGGRAPSAPPLCAPTHMHHGFTLKGGDDDGDGGGGGQGQAAAVAAGALESSILGLGSRAAAAHDPLPTMAAAAVGARADVEGLAARRRLQAAGGDNKVHGGCSLAPRQPAMVVVKGFELGQRGGGECDPPKARPAAGSGRKPGGLASLCRQGSSGMAVSSATSAEVLDASPLSVFRDE